MITEDHYHERSLPDEAALCTSCDFPLKDDSCLQCDDLPGYLEYLRKQIAEVLQSDDAQDVLIGRSILSDILIGLDKAVGEMV